MQPQPLCASNTNIIPLEYFLKTLEASFSGQSFSTKKPRWQ